jgi:Leucine-rich repeat (LRR) protein
MLAFRDLEFLSELRLERNEFRSLPEGSLVSLPALVSLSLAGNHISEVARGAFHMLPSLERLDLSSNAIKRLHPQAFTPRAVPRLQELSLSKNYLGHIAEVTDILKMNEKINLFAAVTSLFFFMKKVIKGRLL